MSQDAQNLRAQEFQLPHAFEYWHHVWFFFFLNIRDYTDICLIQNWMREQLSLLLEHSIFYLNGNGQEWSERFVLSEL